MTGVARRKAKRAESSWLRPLKIPALMVEAGAADAGQQGEDLRGADQHAAAQRKLGEAVVGGLVAVLLLRVGHRGLIRHRRDAPAQCRDAMRAARVSGRPARFCGAAFSAPLYDAASSASARRATSAT